MMHRANAAIERRFVDTRSGRRHIATAGEGFPLLLLHQTPRSWDEYRDVLPLVGRSYRAIAMDTPGFGDSDPVPDGEDSIEAWATAAHDLLDALTLHQVAIVGHHTGAAIAIEMTASRPKRVRALVLSASPFVDAARRERHRGRRAIDEVDRHADGRHLLELWRNRSPFYPQGDITLLERFVVDALKAGHRAAAGHHVVDRYMMEARLPFVSCPTLVIAPTGDPHAHPHAHKVAGAIAGAKLVEVKSGLVPFPDHMPDTFARVVGEFLAEALKGG
jgi:pimeloyl-ACP methyl ester carboxylesterase